MTDSSRSIRQPLLFVVADGMGERSETFGNAVRWAHTPHMDHLRQNHPFCTLWAHGPHVGLPTHKDMGNSEVGHSTIGAGRIMDQGARYVGSAISSGSLYSQKTWQKLMSHMKSQSSTLHFIGLLSDGHVHSHEDHLYALTDRACQEGQLKIRLHLLLDGRDVPPKSALIYLDRLCDHMKKLQQHYGADIQVASGGGRMKLTMDRYEADWNMVKQGWQHHVLGQGIAYSSLAEYMDHLRQIDYDSDQYLDGFVIHNTEGPCGRIQDGDGVVCFHFRADRAIEISQAFCEPHFTKFDRTVFPKVLYVGLVCYDGDRQIPKDYLVDGPRITHTLSEYMCKLGIRQWACSETQKFGHITFYWNGLSSTPFDPQLETYEQIPSLEGDPAHHPAMQAKAITDLTIKRLHENTYSFLRINYPNGDMVGHSGDFKAAVKAMEVVDEMIGQLMIACKKNQTALLITADHGNCEMMRTQPIDHPESKAQPVASHTTNKVPLYIYNSILCESLPPHDVFAPPHDHFKPGLAHLASTVLDLMGLPPSPVYEPSLLRSKPQPNS